MTYRTDPFIPQQAETVASLVHKTTGRGTFGPDDHVSGQDGIWHRLNSHNRQRQPGYQTRCRLVIPVAHARTRIGGELTCENGCGR